MIKNTLEIIILMGVIILLQKPANQNYEERIPIILTNG